MRPSLRILRRAWLGLLLLPLLGCGADPAGKLHPVDGSISVDGKPLTLGSISFRPMKEKGNTNTYDPAAEIEEDGTYSIATQGKPGAPAGWWKVVVSARDPIDPKDPYKPTKSYVAAKYEIPEKTELVVEVREDAPAGAYDLKLTGRP